MKDELKTKFTVFSIILAAGGGYVVYALYRYMDTGKRWNNLTYQTFIQTAVVVLFLILLSFIVIFLYHQKVMKMQDMMKEKESEVTEKNRMIEDLNDRLNRGKIYDTSKHVPELVVLDRYIDKMFDKNIKMFTLIKVSCSNDESERHFLSNINYIKGLNTEVFKDRKGHDYIILMINTDSYDANQDSRYYMTKGSRIKGIKTFEPQNTKAEDVRGFIAA